MKNKKESCCWCCLDVKKCLNSPWQMIRVVVIVLGVSFLFRSKIITAWVNGRPIYRSVYVRELETQAGKQILDTLVTKQLIMQAAKENKITVTKEELAEEMKAVEELADQQGLTLEKLLELQGVSKSQLEEEIKLQKMIEKIVGEDMEVTDEEVSQYLEENRQYLDETATEAELKETVTNQLSQQKLTETVREWIGKLQQEAKVVSW